MTSATALQCAACHRPTTPGQALRVVPRTGNPPPPPFVVHRVSVVAGCLRAAGRVSDASIAEYDPAAARAFDRSSAGDRARADPGATFAAKAIARNSEISAERPNYEMREEE